MGGRGPRGLGRLSGSLGKRYPGNSTSGKKGNRHPPPCPHTPRVAKGHTGPTGNNMAEGLEASQATWILPNCFYD